MKQISILRKVRTNYQPKLPPVFTKSGMKISVATGKKTTAAENAAQIKKLFKNLYGVPTVTFKADKKAGHPVNNVAVILSGGQAPGGHNVIAGIFDALKAANKKNKLYGFLGGPSGLTDNDYIELTAKIMNDYRNSGGFDIIGSGRTKLESKEQFDTTRKNLDELKISALVVIGGDDSNTNAALLAEYFAAEKTGIQVIGVPIIGYSKIFPGWNFIYCIEKSFKTDTTGCIGIMRIQCNYKYFLIISIDKFSRAIFNERV